MSVCPPQQSDANKVLKSTKAKMNVCLCARASMRTIELLLFYFINMCVLGKYVGLSEDFLFRREISLKTNQLN